MNDLALFEDNAGMLDELPVLKSADIVQAPLVSSIDVNRIMQPKTVTYAKYDYSRIQYQVFVRIREELTAHISKNFADLNPKEYISVPVFCSHYPHFHGHIQRFANFLEEMTKDMAVNYISFSWRFDVSRHAALYRWLMESTNAVTGRFRLPPDGTVISQEGLLFTHILHSSDNPDLFWVDINPRFFPFLLYYGNGNGGTMFERDVALRLRSGYAQRFYEKLMDWSSSCSVKVVSFEQLRDFLSFPEQYGAREIRRRVLDVVKSQLEEAGSSVTFEYEFKYNSEFGFVSNASGPLRTNSVVFSIVHRKFDNFDLAVQRVFVSLKEIADREMLVHCKELALRIVNEGKEPFIMSKFNYYNEQMRNGLIKMPRYKNTMLAIVNQSFGVDLRSEAHRRNSTRFMKKNYPESSSGEPRLLFGD